MGRARSSADSGRMRRVNEALREVIAAAIAGELEDPRIGFVTVTAVETSPDLRYARVFVSVLGEERDRASTLTYTRAERRSGLVSTEVTVTNPMRGSSSSVAIADPITSRMSSLTLLMRWAIGGRL